jgi:DUF438 domain-containing protein
MELTPKTKINDLLTRYDFMLDYLVELSPRFSLLKNQLALRIAGNIATLDQAASISGIEINELISKIAKKIEQKTGEKVSYSSLKSPSKKLQDSQTRHEVLKSIIRELHDGADLRSVKKRFQDLICDIDPAEISKMEQQLIDEGMPESEIKRLCDVHVDIFRESLEEKAIPVVPEGHPVHTLMLENRASENIMNKLEGILGIIGPSADRETFHTYRKKLEKLIDSLQKIDLHYLRKENQLFPVFESHNIAGPTKVMWALHDDIRDSVKKARADLDASRIKEFIASAKESIRTIRDMIYKEEHILFPLAVETLSREEWEKVKKGEEEIGYAWIETAAPIPKAETAELVSDKKNLKLDTGTLTAEQVNLILKALPVDISLVDENDHVVYYSDTPGRIFPRSTGVIGRKVQNCHPPKSVHVVQKIIDDFRSGIRAEAEFWIQMSGKFIHIRYYALLDQDASYKGCLEVAQDVTWIRELSGEKRLLDQV